MEVSAAMTRVDFYILKGNAARRGPAGAREVFVCRLTEKVYKQGRHIVLHTDSAAAAAAIDALLWTWRQGSFVPHEVCGGDGRDDCPVLVNHESEFDGGRRDVLINLNDADEPPLFFSRFERVAEIVDAGAQTAAAARRRYRFYKERGHEMQTHDIAG